MFDWREKVFDNDPDDVTVMKQFIKWYHDNRDSVSSWEEVTLRFCKNKSVMDLGGISHNKRSVVSYTWKHRKIQMVASRVLGIDILKEMIPWVNNQGFNFQYADATSDVDFGEEFDVVVCGDLIEHVDNLGGLIRFISRHLKIDGKGIITTPNPLYWKLIKGDLNDEVPIANFEHTCWITPTNMNELCRRYNMCFKKIYEVIPREKLPDTVTENLPRSFRIESYIYIVTNN